jgi:hypothetical protein
VALLLLAVDVTVIRTSHSNCRVTGFGACWAERLEVGDVSIGLDRLDDVITKDHKIRSS